jgi:hypothetical protein
LFGDELAGKAVPSRPLPNHVVACAVEAHPLRVDPALLRATDLCAGSPRVGPGVGGAVQDQQTSARLDEIAVVARPPWGQGNHRSDITASRKVGGDAPAHGMADDGDAGWLESFPRIAEDRFGVAQRIQLWAVPAAIPVLHPPHLNGGAESPSQTCGEERHPQIRQLPAARTALAARLAAGQDQHVAAVRLNHSHECYSAPLIRRLPETVSR